GHELRFSEGLESRHRRINHQSASWWLRKIIVSRRSSRRQGRRPAFVAPLTLCRALANERHAAEMPAPGVLNGTELALMRPISRAASFVRCCLVLGCRGVRTTSAYLVPEDAQIGTSG